MEEKIFETAKKLEGLYPSFCCGAPGFAYFLTLACEVEKAKALAILAGRESFNAV